jgi:hypothetical protein
MNMKPKYPIRIQSHFRSAAAGVRVRSAVKAGGLTNNHNQLRR